MANELTNSPLAITSTFESRDEATRTPDPYVPNVVRYQLRYIPNDFSKTVPYLCK